MNYELLTDKYFECKVDKLFKEINKLSRINSTLHSDSATYLVQTYLNNDLSAPCYVGKLIKISVPKSDNLAEVITYVRSAMYEALHSLGINLPENVPIRLDIKEFLC